MPGQNSYKTKFNKTDWFYRVNDTLNFPDTIQLIKRINFVAKFTKTSLNENFMNYETEDEVKYLNSRHFGNLQFNYRNKLFFYSIKNGSLDKVSIKWKYKTRKNMLTITTQGTLYDFEIINKETIRIPLEQGNKTVDAETILITLVKRKVKTVPTK